MSEHKGDELSVTGSHRVWTGEASARSVRAERRVIRSVTGSIAPRRRPASQ